MLRFDRSHVLMITEHASFMCSRKGRYCSQYALYLFLQFKLSREHSTSRPQGTYSKTISTVVTYILFLFFDICKPRPPYAPPRGIEHRYARSERYSHASATRPFPAIHDEAQEPSRPYTPFARHIRRPDYRFCYCHITVAIPDA